VKKPALYYTLHSGYWHWRVMAVTSVKGLILYGRGEPDGHSTKARGSECFGEFKSEQDAFGQLDKVRELNKTFDAAAEPIDRFLHQLAAERRRVLDLIAIGKSADEIEKPKLAKAQAWS